MCFSKFIALFLDLVADSCHMNISYLFTAVFLVNPGATNPHPVDSKPEDYFSVFWNGAWWAHLVAETNRYAARNPPPAWTNVTIPEMKAFMGMFFFACLRSFVIFPLLFLSAAVGKSAQQSEDFFSLTQVWLHPREDLTIASPPPALSCLRVMLANQPILILFVVFWLTRTKIRQYQYGSFYSKTFRLFDKVIFISLIKVFCCGQLQASTWRWA